MGPLLDHAAVLHDEDLVDGLEPSETVGDEDERASVGHVQEIGGERVGGRGFEVFGRFVEYEHREVGQQGSGHGQTLALTPRQAGPVRPHLGCQPSGKISEPGRQPDPVEHVVQLVVRGVTPPDAQVVGDGGVEQVGILADQSHHRAEVVAG